MNNSIKFTIVTVLAITLATTNIVLKVQSVSAWFGPPCSECGKDFSPGHEAKSPGDAKNNAPGQKAQGPGAKDFAPGREK
jgi:hypothetical protein